MKKLLMLVIVGLLTLTPIASLSFPSVANAQGDPAAGAIQWLKDNQAENGSYAEDNIDSTALASIALALVDEPNAEALAWLEAQFADVTAVNLDNISWTLLAIVANGEDPTTFADGAVLTAFGQQLRKERGADVPRLCLGLIAMNAAGQTLPSTALGALNAFQADDGGFPLAAADEVSSPIATALCAEVMIIAENEEGLTNALAYLADSQLEDGGWGVTSEEETSLGIATAVVLDALSAAEEDLMGDWGTAVGNFMSNMTEDGGFVALGDGVANASTTAFAAMLFRGENLLSIGAEEETDEGDASSTPDEGDDVGAMEEGPALDENWVPVADGFSMTALDSADDFFTTVIDPFTEEELYGAEILNWVAEYQYTGYIIENFLPADVLLWMADQDATFWDTLADSVLKLLPAEVLAELPEDIQARASE